MTRKDRLKNISILYKSSEQQCADEASQTLPNPGGGSSRCGHSRPFLYSLRARNPSGCTVTVTVSTAAEQPRAHTPASPGELDGSSTR